MPARFSDDSPLVGNDNRGDFSDPQWSQEIVISGISGRFPESNNMEEFKENLLHGIDLISSDDRRWPPGLHNTPLGSGKILDIDKFDAMFFGFPAKLTNQSDPQLRMLLEVAYEAIVDAGVNPQSLRGSKTAVFTGCSAHDAESAYTGRMENMSGYTLLGCSNCMLSNRIAYAFDLKGPSTTVDTACSSFMYAFYMAIRGIMSGEYDSALVCGSNINHQPIIAVQFANLNMMSSTSRCRTFDVSGDGFARSEAVGAVFLQRACNAKRIYSSVLNCRSNTDGYKNEGIAFPSGEVQADLLRETYEEFGINPLDVSYIEAHGTGTKAGDPQETNAIVGVLCENRKEPLLIGSVKSVMGHAEGAAGLCQIAKIVIAIQEGIIPPNLHYKNPNPDIPALTNGQLQVITECTKLKSGLIGVSSFGFGGCNVHAVLRPYLKPKSVPVPEGPKFFAISGRTEEAVDVMLSALEKNPDPDMLALLSDIMDTPPSLHHYRGYTILNTDSPVHTIQKVKPEQRPIWYVFSGMGSQWVGMGQDMMRVEAFKNSMKKSHDVLKPYGIDLLNLIMNPVADQFETILNSFVTIASVQVALVDCLRTVGIEPDGMVGHSVGELGCAYADGCFTAEQMVLAAFWRGYCVQNGDLPKGAMAAVGLTWEEVKKCCPPGVVPACHNSEDSVTISGPEEEVKKFVEQLKAEKIFAKEVKSSGRAFHCYMINKIAPALQSALEKIIPSSKPRTHRWISSSIPEKNWNSPLAKSSSPAYHVNNLVNPVLFHEGLQHIPENAVVIEIGPHALLQAVLKRALSSNVVNIGLAHRDSPDNHKHFLNCIGKLYTSGYNFKPSKLYRPVSFPVPINTPMISPLIKWDHSASWRIPKYTDYSIDRPDGFAVASFEVDVSSDESKDYYLVDHKIDGRVIFPGTGYLVMVWKSFAKMENAKHEDLQVQFENVVLHRATILPKTGKVMFNVTIMKGNGEFEVMEGGSLVVSGHIFLAEGRPHETLGSAVKKVKNNDPLRLTKSDIYKELKLRGYEYGPHFQGVLESDLHGQEGKLQWNGNWVTYMDTMLQFSILSKSTRDLCLPTRIPFLRINPSIQPKESEEGVEVYYDSVLNACVGGGVQMMGLKASSTSRRQVEQHPLLEEYQFVPNNENRCFKSLPHFESKLNDYNAVLNKTVEQGVAKLLQQRKKVVPNLEILHSSSKSRSGVSASINQHSFSDDENFDTSAHEFVENVLNVLADEKFTQKGKDLLNHFWSTVIAKDSLISSLRHSRALKPCLDIVLENFLTHSLKVVEVESTYGSLREHLKNEILNQPTSHLDLTLTDLTENAVNSEEEDEKTLKTTKWNPTTSPFSGSESHLIVANYFFFRNRDYLEVALKNFSKSLKPGGFGLFTEFDASNPIAKLLAVLHGQKDCLSSNEFTMAINKIGLKVVCVKSDGFLNTLYLVRKVGPVKKPYILSVDEDCSVWVEKLKDYHANMHKEPEGVNVYIVSEKQPTNGVVGLVNCLRAEGGDRVRCIFNSSFNGQKPKSYEEVYANDLVMNVYRDGEWGSFRSLPLSSDEQFEKTTQAYANVTLRGDLSSLRWIESPLKHSTLKNQKNPLCYVYYAPLNFRDIMLATGKLPPEALPGNMSIQDCLLGLEFSGRNEAGKRVMGLVSSKGLATTVLSDPHFTWEVPDNWSLEDASSVPVVYTTAYYALIVRGQLQPGETVLIHSGSGGVGQAAISIALHTGCTVYTTVGSTEKRDYLKKIFPQLTDSNFANSRNVSFEYDIMKATKGNGVDVILNSLSEEMLQASVRCLAKHGRFLEIGKYDLSKNSPLGMSCFLKNTSFHGILLDALFDTDNPINIVIKKLVDEGIQSGAVRPLKCTVFEGDQLENAFRFMASGKHIGKVVIKIRNEEKQKVIKPSPVELDAISQIVCHPKKSYIITGGLGGFGLELANWLVGHGARYITLTSRSGVRNGYQARCIKQWKEKGVHVLTSTHNISTLQGVQNLIQDAVSHQGPVGGIFHLAMVLKDAVLENQNVELYNSVIDPKVKGAENLDTVSRKLCPHLDWFVVFSSIVAGRGNGGQTNYGFANSAMERVCEKRKQDGLSGLAIQWGAIGDVGVVHENMGGNDVVIGGSAPQRIISCLSTMEKFLNQSHPVMSSIVLAEKPTSRSSKNKSSIVDAIAHILGVKDVRSLSSDITLSEMGLDSLMGVEVKQTLERDYDSILTMQEINQLTITKLKEIEMKSSSSSDTSKSNAVSTENGYDLVVKSNIRFDTENLNPEKCIIPLNQQTQGLPLFIVHPIEGNVNMLNTLAEKLSFPVYGIQCTPRTPLSSIESMAAYYVQEIHQIQAQGPYQLAGYSFGCSVAFEMAVHLQRDYPKNLKIVKNLIMLDGSPNYVAAHTAAYTSVDASAQADGLLVFVEMFIEVNTKQEKQELVRLSSWDERVAYAVDLLMPSNLFKSRDDVTQAINSFYNRILASHKYLCNKKFKGSVTLIRAKNNAGAVEALGKYYSLDKVCSEEVHLSLVDGSHEDFILDPNAEATAATINNTVVSKQIKS